MVKLTEFEQRMLNGEMGRFKQRAIEKIVDYARILGAEELVPITKCTLFYGNHPYMDEMNSDDFDVIFSEEMLCTSEVIPLGEFSDECFSQTCAAPCDHYCYEECGLTKEVFDKNHRFLQLTKEAGVSIVNSCTPYQNGWLPLRGEHYATTESSNVLFCNSVLGACGHADGMEITSCAAICGRIPLWGLHDMSKRYATHVVDITCQCKTAMDWDVVGFGLGHMLAHGNPRPVLASGFERPDMNKLKKFFSALASTSGCEICHIVGCTAEAPTLEAALDGHEPIEHITFTQEDYDRTLAMLCDEGSANAGMVVLGCPHYSLEEIRDVAMMLKGKKVHENVTLQIWTDITMQKLAEINGYDKMITDAGAYLLNSGCPQVNTRGCYKFASPGSLITDAAKQTYYGHELLNSRGIKVFYGTTQQCIDAAISGRWEEK